MRGIVFAVSDDHPGLKRAIMEVVPEAYWLIGSAATCIFYATRSTICLARSPTTAWLNYVHAEVNALTNMVSAGGGRAIAVLVASNRKQFTPCGGCLDWIFELGGPDTIVAFESR